MFVKKRRRQIVVSLASLVLCLLCFDRGAQASHSDFSDTITTCPIELPIWKANTGNQVETKIVQTNGYAQIVKMEFCTYGVNGSGQTIHPIGFRFHYNKVCGVGGVVPETFDCGTYPSPFPAGDTRVRCQSIEVGEDIAYVRLGKDGNDFEQVELTAWSGGAPWIVGTNDDGKNYKNYQLLGRPIGFKCITGDRYFGGKWNRNPHGMGIIYSECNCPMSYFMPQVTPSLMKTTVLGADAVQALPYFEDYIEHVYAQNCGTYTVEFTPPYAAFFFNTKNGVGGPHNKPFTDEMQLRPTLDSEVGLWDVEMKIRQITANGDGGTQTGFTNMRDSDEADCQGKDFSTYKFKLQVDPCLPTFTVGGPPADMTYVIGTGPATTADSGPWTLTQTPNCGYDYTCTSTGAPSFVDVWTDDRKIDVDAMDDLSTKGQYAVTVTCSIQRPKDYTRATYETISTSFTWRLDVQDPCESAVLCSPTECPFPDLLVNVLGPAHIESYTEKWDDVSQTFGQGPRNSKDGYEFCGARECSASPNYSFHTLDHAAYTNKLVTTNKAHIGEYNVNIKCWLVDYPTREQTYNQFLTIYPCVITAFVPTPEPQHNYHVYTTPAETITWVEWVQVPNCDINIGYTIQVENPDHGTRTNLPAFIGYTTSSKTFSASTNNLGYVKTWNLSIRGCYDAWQGVPARYAHWDLPTNYCEEQIIVLDVDNGCLIDTITPTSTIVDDLYYINQDGLVTYTPTYSGQSVAGCPMTYELRIVDNNGNERTINAAEDVVLDFYNNINSQDGRLTANTNNYNLDGQIWHMKLFKRSTYSASVQQDAVYLFDIEFRDPCWDSVLQAASAPDYTFDVWELQTLTFNQMVDQSLGLACFGYTYSLEYQDSGPLWDSVTNTGPSLAHYSLGTCTSGTTPCSYGGTIHSLDWEGVHPFKIVGQNGRYNAGQSRGANGLWKTIESDTFHVTIRNPCRRSEPNLDNGISVNDMENWVWEQTLDVQTFRGPTDWASATYGNGYNKCGELMYRAVDSNFNLGSHSYMWITFEKNKDASDDILMKVQTDERVWVGVHQHYMKAWLYDYPEAPPGYIPFTVTIHECILVEFSPPKIPYTQYVVQGRRKYINFQFVQVPCDYICEYEVFVVNATTGEETSVPKFISYDAKTPTLNVYSWDNKDEGLYPLKVVCTLDDSKSTQSVTYFDLEVFISPLKIDANIEPFFANELMDQCVTVGDEFFYALGPAKDVEGNGVVVEALLDKFDEWLKFEDGPNIFSVRAGATTNSHVGIHKINITMTDDNEEDPLTVKRSFKLEVMTGLCEEPTPMIEEDPLFYNASEWRIRNSTNGTLGPYSKDQPIPYIQELTSTGLLTLGWDREMSPYENFTEIYPDGLAVRQLRKKGLFFTAPDIWEELTIVPALEIEVQPGEMSDKKWLNITSWEMIGFSDQWIWIQLNFTSPQRLSEEVVLDDLKVTFWGTQYFKSKAGFDVRFGTVLTTPIMQQMDPAMAVYIDYFAAMLETVIVLLLLCVLILSYGRLLPFWGFINTLQLITHAPLLEVLMPANATLVLKRLLNVARFDWLPITDNIRYRWGYEGEPAGHSPFFASLGYKQINIVPQLGFIFVAAFVILGVYLLALAKDLFVKHIYRPKGLFWHQKHEQWMFNFAVRFVYEVFLEVCLCTFVHLSHWGEQTSGNFFALVVLLASIAFILLVEYLFWKRSHLATPEDGAPKLKTMYELWQESRHGAQVKAFADVKDIPTHGSQGDIGEDNKRADDSNQVGIIDPNKADDDQQRVFLSQGGGPAAVDSLEKQLNNTKAPKRVEQSPQPLDQTAIYDQSMSVEHEKQSARVEVDIEDQGVQQSEQKKAQLQNSPGVASTFGACFSAWSARASPKKTEPVEKNPLDFQTIDRFEGGEVDGKAVITEDDPNVKGDCPEDGPKDQGDSLETATIKAKEEEDQLLLIRARPVAKQMIEQEELVKPIKRIKTLLYGLKMNHPMQVELVHPLMFLARRLLFAWIAVVAYADAPIRQVEVFIMSSFAMLILLHVARPWKHWDIQLFFVFNEWAVYVTGLFLLCFTPFVASGYDRFVIGWVFICFVFLVCVVNIIVVWMMLLRRSRLHWIRGNLLDYLRQRELFKASKKNKVGSKIRTALGAMQPARNNTEDDSEVEGVRNLQIQVFEDDLDPMRVQADAGQQMSDMEDVPHIPSTPSEHINIRLNDFGLDDDDVKSDDGDKGDGSNLPPISDSVNMSQMNLHHTVDDMLIERQEPEQLGTRPTPPAPLELEFDSFAKFSKKAGPKDSTEFELDKIELQAKTIDGNEVEFNMEKTAQFEFDRTELLSKTVEGNTVGSNMEKTVERNELEFDKFEIGTQKRNTQENFSSITNKFHTININLSSQDQYNNENSSTAFSQRRQALHNLNAQSNRIQESDQPYAQGYDKLHQQQLNGSKTSASSPFRIAGQESLISSSNRTQNVSNLIQRNATKTTHDHSNSNLIQRNATKTTLDHSSTGKEDLNHGRNNSTTYYQGSAEDVGDAPVQNFNRTFVSFREYTGESDRSSITGVESIQAHHLGANNQMITGRSQMSTLRKNLANASIKKSATQNMEEPKITVGNFVGSDDNRLFDIEREVKKAEFYLDEVDRSAQQKLIDKLTSEVIAPGLLEYSGAESETMDKRKRSHPVLQQQPKQALKPGLNRHALSQSISPLKDVDQLDTSGKQAYGNQDFLIKEVSKPRESESKMKEFNGHQEFSLKEDDEARQSYVKEFNGDLELSSLEENAPDDVASKEINEPEESKEEIPIAGEPSGEEPRQTTQSGDDVKSAPPKQTFIKVEETIQQAKNFLLDE